ncbi:MAG: urease accessory protein UreD [Bradyrhizobiaceae bacterium]|nr:MAG: urease accessory protein UreD [Bradyrhizobiaceae bacterium]
MSAPLSDTRGHATDLTDPPNREWKAEIELGFEVNEGRTRLLRRRQYGPLVVQRPFYPEKDGTCHVYLLHPPAGIVGGDKLHYRFDVGEGARCVLTTPGATKFYRSAVQDGLQRNEITVAAGGVCEYLPQETILFDGARARIDTRVTLADGATFAGWDFICLGRPAADERFTTGTLSQRIEIVRNNETIWFERFQLSGDSPLLQARYAIAGRPVFGTMIYVSDLHEETADRIRESLNEKSSYVFSVSQLQHLVVCRYLGEQAEEGKNLFSRAWDVLRSNTQNKPACPPRIWAT